jgi:hypothetical protein
MLMFMEYKCICRTVWGYQWEGAGERTGYGGVKMFKVPHIYTCEDRTITHQTPFEKGGWREWKYNGRVNLFTVHCSHVWHYHNEILLYY